MRVSIGGDTFLVLHGKGRPNPHAFPPLERRMSGWIYVDHHDPRRLYYFNYLKHLVPFCGNAARVLGYILLGGKNGSIEVYASGPKFVIVRDGKVGITLNLKVGILGDHTKVRMEGVEHLVFPVSGVQNYPLRALYISLRSLKIHVNIYEKLGDHLFVRTWEYNYPNEPEGCATGTLAAASDYLLRNSLHRITTLVRSGDMGEVSGDGETFTLWHRIRIYTP
ncbi:MAG: hypothetical protein GXO39_05200 [Thermotogae bacterium]|nr:hypothetical protein [Thermotogota bacterium]